MPYRGWESLAVGEECVRNWASDLKPKTARNYVYYFLKYLEWARGNGYWSSAGEMLADFKGLSPEERFKHVDILEKYVKTLNSGFRDRVNRWYAVRSFYEYHRLPLPKPPKSETARFFRPSDRDKKRAIQLKALELEEIRQLVLNAPQPYKAAFMVIFQGAIGLAEFEEFNTMGWRAILKRIEEPGPVRIDLYREKTSRTSVSKYYTFLGEDAKRLVKDWLAMRPQVDSEALFLTFNKNRNEWVPVKGRSVGDAITKVAKRIGLIKENGLGQYHIHAHEFRDLFKSLCTLNGVNPIASEYFLGHTIDKLGYDKSPQYDEEWFRREYVKVEPQLNLISNPQGDFSKRMDRLRSEVVLESVRSFAKALGIDPMRIRIEKQKQLKREPTPEEEVQLLQEQVKKLRIVQPENGSNNGKPYSSKVISEDELPQYVEEGWEIVRELSNRRYLVKKANHVLNA